MIIFASTKMASSEVNSNKLVEISLWRGMPNDEFTDFACSICGMWASLHPKLMLETGSVEYTLCNLAILPPYDE